MVTGTKYGVFRYFFKKSFDLLNSTYFSKIFIFILERIRFNYWNYANISCAAYPLDNIDSIAIDGSTDMNSCLYIVLNTVISINMQLFFRFCNVNVNVFHYSFHSCVTAFWLGRSEACNILDRLDELF
jgi:hypothetical protein